MIIETETDFDTLARMDAEMRDFDPAELPTRAEVENGHAANGFDGRKPMPKDTDAPQRFTITDEASADWFLEKLADIEAKKARLVANTAARVAELEADARALHSRFDSEFQAFCEQEAARRRRKTVTLPNGSGVFRTAPRKLVIADGEAAFCHARTAFAHCIKEQTTVTLDTAAYIAEAEKTGELLPGLDAVPEREVFKVDTSAPKAKGGANLPA